MQRLSRLEIQFHEDGTVGAQCSVAHLAEIDGAARIVGETTTGLDAGGNPEYAATLEATLGEALTEALARNAALAQAREALEADLQAAAQRIAELEAAAARSTSRRRRA